MVKKKKIQVVHEQSRRKGHLPYRAPGHLPGARCPQLLASWQRLAWDAPASLQREPHSNPAPAAFAGPRHPLTGFGDGPTGPPPRNPSPSWNPAREPAPGAALQHDPTGLWLRGWIPLDACRPRTPRGPGDGPAEAPCWTWRGRELPRRRALQALPRGSSVAGPSPRI